MWPQKEQEEEDSEKVECTSGTMSQEVSDSIPFRSIIERIDDYSGQVRMRRRRMRKQHTRMHMLLPMF